VCKFGGSTLCTLFLVVPGAVAAMILPRDGTAMLDGSKAAGAAAPVVPGAYNAAMSFPDWIRTT
jgi:hypothetical protein